MTSLETMSAYKSTVCLLTCVLIICYERQGAQCLQMDAATTATGDGRAGSLGIAFPRGDKAFLVAASSAASEGQLESSEDRHQKSSGGDEHWQSKRLRFEYPSSPAEKDLDQKELLRRYHIEQLLEALTGTIPPSPKKLRASQRLASGEPAAAIFSTKTSGQQIFRSGRTFPRDSSESGGVLVKQSWQNGNTDGSMLDGRSESRNEQAVVPIGIIWSEPSDRSGGKSRPMVAAKQPRSRVHDEQINQKTLSELISSENRRVSLGRIYPAEQSLVVRNSHRSGSEEIPIHTPIHSTHSGGDYEAKRVENSRGWNNLRGMWGKRSTDAAENNRRLFEAQEQGAGAASLESAGARSNDDGSGAFDDYTNDADKDQQTLTSGMQSIRPM